MVLFLTGMLVDLSVAIKQLEGCAAHMQMTVPAGNMWMVIFIVILQMEVVSVAIMQVVFSAGNSFFLYFFL